MKDAQQTKDAYCTRKWNLLTYSPVNTIGASSTAGPSHDKYSSSLPDENRPMV